MKKYLIIALIGLIAAGAMVLKYPRDSYSYEVKTSGTSSPAASKQPEIGKTGNESGLKPINIVLSPHFDDAVLSLGGSMSGGQAETKVDVFFAGKPSKDLYTEHDKASGFWDSDEAVPLRILENKKALGEFGLESKNYDYLESQYRGGGQDAGIERSIEKDIEAIMAQYPSRQISIYGPAVYDDKVTDPDHKILHEAFMAEAKKNKNANIQFLVYEDFPYISEFSQGNPGSLKGYLESAENINLEELDIAIDQAGLAKKAKGIKDYVSSVTAFSAQKVDIASLSEKFSRGRCKASHPDWYACEVAYKVQI